MSGRSGTGRVVVIGAGVGGLAAALALAARGVEVTVVERADRPGGKLRQVEVDGEPVDCGPTVLTMRGVFDSLFAEAGETLDHHLRLTPAGVLARHAWQQHPDRLDLHADPEQTVEAIAAFAGLREARGYRAFCADARAMFQALDAPFIQADRPEMSRMMAPALQGGFAFAAAPFQSLWRRLGRYFADARLRQLFARYATYCGSSPFLSPATLMLVAHVEQMGVWTVSGGMVRLAEALEQLARSRGVAFRYRADVASIAVERSRAAAVVLADGERIGADAVVCNADCGALGGGLFGEAARAAVAAPNRAGRSFSAVTFALRATVPGFPLAHHSVFFSPDYRAEFDDLAAGRVPANPTVYVCAQDRDAAGAAAASPERLFCIVNAPATGDANPFDEPEIAQCEARTFQALERCGLTLHSPAGLTATTPATFHQRYPATGGALYGAASHGWMASFRRSGVRSRVPGLYLCGGSVHPGPGLPMAALSGRMAARALIADWASTRRFHPVATPGGMSTASATTAGRASR